MGSGVAAKKDGNPFERREHRKGQERKAELDALLGPPAPAAPDLTDEHLRKVRAAQMLRMLQQRGRGSTYLTGPVGDTRAPNVGKTLLGG